MAKPGKAKFAESFGVFSPTGHIVMAFPSDGDATKAAKALLDGGFKNEDIVQYSNTDILTEFKKSEKQSASPLQIGQDVVKAEEFLALAEEGCGFLVVHAPKGEQSKRAITIVKPYGLKFAEKYNHLTIEELA